MDILLPHASAGLDDFDYFDNDDPASIGAYAELDIAIHRYRHQSTDASEAASGGRGTLCR